MNRYICIHGHFYQPPRENAWLEEVELQDSAYPYHDWNERITAECYAPNAASRILDDQMRIIDIVNNYSKMSFNVGPTLLSWMERHAPELHAALVEADAQSQAHFSGHGSAIAQVYNHMIMPLASARDKHTQVAWGIRDFERRFGRSPEGMWLAETAVDIPTLEALVEQGIRFTILAPGQARRVRRFGRRWRDVTGGRIDPRQAYLCKLPSGNAINIFFYDGPISRDVAFSDLLNSGETFAGRLMGAFLEEGAPQLVHIATDGETYGHHHGFGDMALAYCLNSIEASDRVSVTVYGEFLDRFPPTREVEIIENTSWSCAHGVERWRSNCGCNTGRGWSQDWRQPLREAMDWLRDTLEPIYEKEMSSLVHDPGRARDDYIDVILDRQREISDGFLARHSGRDLTREEINRALSLLEMQRHAMLMYTSCGWFFDEISGMETTQVLQYAARAIQLAELTTGIELEGSFIDRLHKAPSNIPEYGDGAQVYLKLVKPAMVDLLRVGAHYAISSLFGHYEDVETLYCYSIEREISERVDAGRQKLLTGRARIRSDITLAEDDMSFAVVHLGDHNLIGAVRSFQSQDAYDSMLQGMSQAFRRSDVPEMIRELDKHFETHSYSLWHLFRDEQRSVLASILESALNEVAASFRSIYTHHYPIMQVMRELGNPIPKALATTAEFTINVDLRRALEADLPDVNLLQNLVGEVTKWSFEVDRETLRFVAAETVSRLLERLDQNPEDLNVMDVIDGTLGAIGPLALSLDLWKAQNLHFSVSRRLYGPKSDSARRGDRNDIEWVERFDSLGRHLQVRSV
jgi:alpha-amylase/alpha-mannosidase (GH57 family)